MLGSEGDALQLAVSALDLVEADPSHAAALAKQALDRGRRQRDPEAEVAALHALSFAQHELGDPRAIRTIRRAVRIGERQRLTRRTALARRRLALDLAGRGAIAAAMLELDLACAALDPLEQARSEVFRVAVLWLAGSATVPLEATDRALATLRRHGDRSWEARLLRNRGGLLAERGDTIAAKRDLTRARHLLTELGAHAAAIATESELARVALIRGDLPECLSRLDAVESPDLAALAAAELALIRAQATSAARLRLESLEALNRAQSLWTRARRDDHVGRLEAIRLTLLAGDARAARELAQRTRRSFAAQHREVAAARAAGLALAAGIAAGVTRRSELRSGRRAAAILAAAGWRLDSERVRLTIARAALALGSPALAERELTACTILGRRGPIADRIEVRHVRALLLRAQGDHAGAQRAAREGLVLLERYRETLGASDLRAAASEIGVELAQLGLGIALTGADTSAALAWAERLRSSATRLPPVSPPKDPELRDHEIELRQVNAEIQREQRAGPASRTLRARQAALEESIRRRARHAAGRGGAVTGESSRRELVTALGDAGLVELIELDGTLTALTLVGTRLTRHELGPVEPVAEQLDWLRFALTRLAGRRQTREQRDATYAGARASSEALDRLLVQPLADALGDRDLVIVPTGTLHGVPWSALPSLRGRPLVIAPSAATWLGLQTRSRRRSARVVTVAGPRLRHAAAEATAVGGLYADATLLEREQSTAHAVMRALNGATVAHLACHGHFRADSPLFSSLELADGLLNVYELQRLRRAPELIVLSACDLAVSDARPGDELLGFAAALIGMGSRTVIASVVRVPDAAAKGLMVAFHEQLVAGRSPAAALAGAQAALGPARAALAGFVCLGTG
ncbi:MAG: CHAT domain-containing protein [Conexibacteraceae bacterium]|nr:CHAT domain-containing protein [Conexibacteraceae bacterium]